MKTNTIIILAAAGIGLYFLLNKKTGSGTKITDKTVVPSPSGVQPEMGFACV